MTDEFEELLDTAIYKETATQAWYEAALNKTEDPGAKVLLIELAEGEKKHSQWLNELKDRGFTKTDWHPERVTNLKISEYLTHSDYLEGAGPQEILVFAMKREQEAVEFYSRMMSVLRDEKAKRLCETLVHEELRHKLRLELIYENLLYGQNY